jgi:hypothetical protein
MITQGKYAVKGYPISHRGGGRGLDDGAGGEKDVDRKQDPGSVRSGSGEEAEDDKEEENEQEKGVEEEEDELRKRDEEKAWYIGTESIMSWWY